MRAAKIPRPPSEAEERFAQQVRASGLPPVTREYWFARDIGRRWRFDFAWPEHMLALECEGGAYTQGRHVRPLGFRQDCEKYLEAACRGWTVLRVTPEMVKSGEAIRGVQRVMGVLSLARWLVRDGRLSASGDTGGHAGGALRGVDLAQDAVLVEPQGHDLHQGIGAADKRADDRNE